MLNASVEFVSGFMDLSLIPPGNVFEKDLVGRAADNMRNFVTLSALSVVI